MMLIYSFIEMNMNGKEKLFVFDTSERRTYD